MESSMAELRVFLANMNRRQDNILSRIDAINARITHMQGRGANAIVGGEIGLAGALDVGGGVGAGAIGLDDAGDPIGVGDQIQLDVIPADEVELDVTSADEVEGKAMKAEEVVVEKTTSEEFGGEKLTAEEVTGSAAVVDGGNGAGATGLGNTGDPVGVGDRIQLDVTPAEKVELDVTSADEVEGKAMKAEEVVVEKTTSEEFGGEKLTAEEVNGSAAVIGGGNGAGATGLGDTGDPIGVGDQIQLDVTPAEGVTGRAIVDRSNETGLGDGGGSVQIGDELRLNVNVTPAGGDGENVSSEDVTDAGNGVGTVGVDGAGDQSLVDRRVRKRSTVTRAVAERICNNFCLMIVLFVVGAVCSFISPFFLTMDAFSRLCYGALAAVSFLVASIIGYKFRRGYFLRATPKLSVRLMFIILSSILTNIVANLIETSDQYYYTFTFIGLAVFCLVELAQPTCDYGLMQFFVCLPLQIAIPLHGLAFHWSYIPACVIPLFCLPTQLFFIEYFDEDYQKLKKSTNPLEAPLLGDDMV